MTPTLPVAPSRVLAVAHRGNYEDVGGFRRLFRKIVGLTPSEYRRRFSRSFAAANEPAAS